MKKTLLTLLVVCAFGVFTAMAQDNSSGMGQTSPATPTQNTGAITNPSQSGSTSTLPPQNQSAMSNGATETSNGTDQQAEGCLVKDKASYYVQPESGGARTELSPSRTLDAFVGQHVRVTGHNGTSDTATATSSGAGSAMSDQSGMLMVTNIKVIANTCNPSGATMPQR